MKLIKVKNYPSLCRDVISNAIINVNNDEYNEYLKRKEKILNEQKKLKQYDIELNNIKLELFEIKELLIKVLNNANNK